MAAAFVAGGFWFQVLIARRSASLAPALMVGSLFVRLIVLAAVVVPLAVYADINLLALLLAFAVAFTVLQICVIAVQVRRSDEGPKGE
jgi:hypothetical protein